MSERWQAILEQYVPASEYPTAARHLATAIEELLKRECSVDVAHERDNARHSLARANAEVEMLRARLLLGDRLAGYVLENLSPGEVPSGYDPATESETFDSEWWICHGCGNYWDKDDHAELHDPDCILMVARAYQASEAGREPCVHGSLPGTDCRDCEIDAAHASCQPGTPGEQSDKENTP